MSSRKLALFQIILAAAAFVLVIMALIFAHGAYQMFSYNLHTTWGVFGLLSLLITLAMIVIGIIQIVAGSKEGNGLGIAAGITGLLSIIPFVGIAAFVLNIIILAKK